MDSSVSQSKSSTKNVPNEREEYLKTLPFYSESSKPLFGKFFILHPKFIELQNKYTENGTTNTIKILLPFFIDWNNILQIGEDNYKEEFGNYKEYFSQLINENYFKQKEEFYEFQNKKVYDREKFLKTLPFYSERLISNSEITTSEERIFILFPQKIYLYEKNDKKGISLPYIIKEDDKIFIDDDFFGNYENFFKTLLTTKTFTSRSETQKAYNVKEYNCQNYFKTLFFYSENLTLKDEIHKLETKVFTLFPQEIYLFDKNSSLKEKPLSQYIDDNDILYIDGKKFGYYEEVFDKIKIQEEFLWEQEMYIPFNYKTYEREEYFNTLNFYSKDLTGYLETQIMYGNCFVLVPGGIFLSKKNKIETKIFLKWYINSADILYINETEKGNYKKFFDKIKNERIFEWDKTAYNLYNSKNQEREEYLRELPFYFKNFNCDYINPKNHKKGFIMFPEKIYLVAPKPNNKCLSQFIDKNDDLQIEKKNFNNYVEFLEKVKKEKTFIWEDKPYETLSVQTVTILY